MTFFYAKNLRRTSKGRWVRPLISPLDVDGVGIDSRADLTGKAFVAIHGERHDGHDYLAEAIRAGARLLIVDREPVQVTLPPDIAVLRVDDTRAALARLASAYRRTLIDTTVIAITGSAGKTTTKHLIDAVLSTTLRGTAAPKSFNNDIGLPLTILNAHVDDAYLIVEIGANRLGEVDTLAAIAQPDIAVITTVGRAHLEGFGSVENVAKEKAALLDHLQSNGLGILIADAPQLRNYRGQAQSIVWFGQAQDAGLRLTDRGACDETWWFEVNGQDRFQLGLPGAHNAVNALAAVAVGQRLGLSKQQIDQGLADCEPVAMRMTCHKLGEMTIYNDAYNANPDSMIAALDTFAELTIDADRRVVILGDMLELGAQAEAL
ncbi:MAG: UDP-N-acetylmuramoyl-tripeptide--D-alanyl-D-alanine ligase, partial [Phycisphaerales bacterium]